MMEAQEVFGSSGVTSSMVFPSARQVCLPQEFSVVAAAPCAGDIKHPLAGHSLVGISG